jgi:outer membrane lipoprotein SlyB
MLFGIALLVGCASDRQGGIGGNTGHAVTTRFGVVESVTPVELDASSGGGSSVGGIFGQVGGANTGGGRGAVVGTILGGVLGGTLGHQAGIATKPGLEIWVKLDGAEGKSAYAMQPGEPDAFKAGDRVRVVRRGGETRVEHETAAPGTPKDQPEETPRDAAEP